MTDSNPDRTPAYNSMFESMMEFNAGMPFLADLGRFNEAREELYAELRGFAFNMYEFRPGDHNPTFSSDAVGERFGEVLKDMAAAGETIDEITDTAVEIMLRDIQERIEMMNSVLGDPEQPSETMACYEEHEVRTFLNKCVKSASSREEEVEYLIQAYGSDLIGDIDQFIEHLMDAYEIEDEPNTPVEQTPEDTKGLKAHALDVAKIALGVTVALAANRLFDRKK